MSPLDQRLYPDERRVVTILFVDLTGFTEMVERRDPEEVTELINRYFAVVTEVVGRYGGHVDKFLGDAVMALFGAPRSTETDPERAVRTALEIVERVRDLGRQSPERIKVHIGIETGLVVAGYLGSPQRMEYTVIGDSVNLAARIQAVAGPNQILIGPNTYARTASQFRYEARGEHQLKGKAHPIALYEPTGRLAADHLGSRAAPFSGRDLELATLHRVLEKVSSGEPRLMLVFGQPGIGKTRLVGTFLSSLDPSVRVAVAGCDEFGASEALDPIVNLLAVLWNLNRSSPDLAADLDKVAALRQLKRAALRDLFRLDTDDEWYRSLPPVSKRERWIEVVAGAFRDSDTTTVAVIDDIQWADAATLEIIESLLGQSDRGRLLLLLVSRPGFEPEWIGHPTVTAMKLEPLSEQSSRALVHSLLGGSGSPQAEEDIIHRAGGNALFITELVRSHRQVSGPLAAEGPSELPPSDIPESVHDVIAARIDLLPDQARGILQTASVIGSRFAVPLLEALTSAEDVDEEVARLVVDEFIAPDMGTSNEYMFVHALTRQVAYQTLLLKTRRSLHAQVAQAVERSGIEEASPLLAHHLAAAGEVERALEQWHAIAQRNIQRSANADAIATIENALTYLPQFEDDHHREGWELRLRTTLGAALMASEGPGSERVETSYTRARDLARATADAREHFPILFGLFRFFLLRARLPESAELSEDMMRMARRFEDVDMMLEAHFASGATSFWRGELVPARSHLTELLEASEWIDEAAHVHRYGQDPVSVGLAYLGWSTWLLGDDKAALEIAQRARDRASALSHPFSNTYSHLGLAMLAQLREDVDTAARQVAQAKALAGKYELRYFSAMAELIGAWCDAKLHDPSEAVDRFSQLLPPFFATGARAGQTYYGWLHADACLDAGRIDEGIAAAGRALAAAHETGEVVWVPPILRARAKLFVEKARNDMAEEDIRQMQEVAQAQGSLAFLQAHL